MVPSLFFPNRIILGYEMLAKFSDTLNKYAKGRLILAFLALEILFDAVIFPGIQAKIKAGSGGTGLIDSQFFYTPEKVYSMIASYGEAGRAAYRTFSSTVDIIYPICYTLLLSLLMTWLFQRGFASHSKLQRLNVVPFGAGLFDVFENLSILAMLSSYPSQVAIVAWLATSFTMAKWSFVGASLGLVLAGLIRFGKDWSKNVMKPWLKLTVLILILGFFYILLTPDFFTPREFYISARDRKVLENQANHGDAEAALKLADYYNFSKRDYVTGAAWVKRSAELGNEQAIRLHNYLESIAKEKETRR